MRVDPPLLMPPPRPRGAMAVAPAESGAARRGGATPPPARASAPGVATDRLPAARLAALRLAGPRRESGGEGVPEPPALRAFRDIGALDASERLTRGGRIDVIV